MADDNNFSRVVRLSTDDFKFTANMGVFAGRIDIAVFENATKSAPVVTILLTPTSAYQFKVILRKILSDPEVQPIELGFWPFNRDLKLPEFKGSITVGRDNEKCIYFDMAGDRHKDPIRFYLLTDRSYRINGNELPKQSHTEAGCNMIIEMLSTLSTLAVIHGAKKQTEFDSDGSSTFAPVGGGTTFTPAVSEPVPF